MKCWVAWAVGALALLSLCACGLERGGLLDDDAAGLADEGGGDAPPTGLGTGGDDGAQTGDGEDVGDADAGADGNADAPDSGDAVADAFDDRRADGHADAQAEASLDATLDAVVDGDAGRDAIGSAVDGSPDGSQAMDASIDVLADVAEETGPLPIVWDGGAIVDPQFGDGDWINFCAALVACAEMPSVSGCVGLIHQPSSPDALIPTPNMVASVNNAEPDCTRVRRALGDGTACPSATPDACSGNVLTTCRMGFTMKVDCGDLGMVCSSGNGNAGCGFGDCAASQEGETYCVGQNYLAECTAGRYEPFLDCQTFGGTCSGPKRTAQCQGTGGPMCRTGASSCDGTSIVECMGGLLGSVDCSSMYDQSFSCFVDSAGAPRCAAGTTCDPATNTDDCTQKGSVRFCNAGVRATYDCAGNGYSGCDTGKCFL